MFVIQIGAQDGISDCHRGVDEVWTGVTKLGWHGVLVEPSPKHFNELSDNYKDYIDKVVLCNYAINTYNGKTIFYDCEETGASTLIESVLIKNNYHDGKAKNYKQITVPCITINTLLEQYGVPEYLIIDTEGFDGCIIEELDFTKYPIPKIRFEFSHITEEQLGRVCLKLIKLDYVLSHDMADIIAQRTVNENK